MRQQFDLLNPRHEVSLLDKSNRDLRGAVSTGIRMIYSPRLLAEVEGLIRTFRPDVIHVHNSYPALGPAVFLGARRLRIPLVMTVHNYRLRCPNGYMFTEDSTCSRCIDGGYHNAVLHSCFPTKEQGFAYATSLWVHRFLLRLEGSVSAFVSPSEFMRRTLLEWGLDPERMRMIRNFTFTPPDANSRPGTYGIYVGRLSREKGIHVLLEALSRAGDPPFKLVGDGPQTEHLRREASRLRLNRIDFVGRATSDKVDRLLRGARFMAVPSIWNENAPLAALEAMARGRPLIVSSLGGLPELAEGGRGWIAQPGNARELSNKIRTLMDDADRCQKAGDAALAFARHDLSAERHLSLLEETYDEAVG